MLSKLSKNILIIFILAGGWALYVGYLFHSFTTPYELKGKALVADSFNSLYRLFEGIDYTPLNGYSTAGRDANLYFKLQLTKANLEKLLEKLRDKDSYDLRLKNSRIIEHTNPATLKADPVWKDGPQWWPRQAELAQFQIIELQESNTYNAFMISSVFLISKEDYMYVYLAGL